MKPVRPLLVLAVAAICAALLWIVFSGSESSPDSQLEDDATASTAEEPELAAVDDAPANKIEEDRVQIEGEGSRYVVHVVDESGSSLAHVTVGWFEVEAEMVNRYGSWQDMVFWAPSASSKSKTDERGRLEIVAAKPLIAFVCSPQLSGNVLCGHESQVANEQDEYTLSVRPRRTVEVIVKDATGQLADDSLFQLQVQFAEIAAIDGLQGSSDSANASRVWRYDNAIGVVDDGRRMLCLDLSPSSARKFPEGHGRLRHRVSLDVQGASTQVREVERDDEGPIVFQLAATGEIAIQILDAPEGVRPALGLPGARLALAENLEPEDGWYRFRSVEIEQEFEVSLYVIAEDGARKLNFESRIPRITVSGPSVADEVIEHVLPFTWPPGFRGKFVLPEGADFDLLAVLDEFDRSGSAAEFTFSGGETEWARCTFFPDGNFSMPVDTGWGQIESVEDVTGFKVRARGLHRRSLAGEGPWRATRCWATVQASLPNQESVVDVGDVVLKYEDPLLEVNVVDSNEDPVPDAELTLMWHDSRQGASTRLRESNRSVETDGVGEAWVLGDSWEDLLRIPEFDPRGAAVTLTAIALRVEVEGYTPQVHEIQIGQREAKIQVSTGASLTGSVFVLRNSDYVRVSVVPSGKNLPSNCNERVLQIDVDGRQREEGELMEFELAGIPAGTWDVILAETSIGFADVVRIDGISVSGGEVVQDPRLQKIDLSDYIQIAFVRLRDESGALLTTEQIEKANFSTFRPNEGGGGSFGNVRQDSDRLAFHIGAGAKKLDSAFLASESYQRVSLSGLVAGEQERSLSSNPEFQLEIVGFDSLPAESSIELSASCIGTSTSMFRTGHWTKGQGVVQLETPGAWNFFGWIHHPGRDRSLHFSASVEVTQEDFDAGASLRIEIPQETLDEIPR